MANKTKKQGQRPAQTKVQVTLKPPAPPVQEQREGKTLRLHQKELIIRLSGLEKSWAIPLHPGRTGAPRLDSIARQHAWTKWRSTPKVSYRSLSPTETSAICSYLVVHDATLAQVTQPAYWDTMSRQYTANKASVSFTHPIALPSLINQQLSNQSDSCSWFLLKIEGANPAPGELWLEYDVEMGGVADLQKSSITFVVKDGKFYEEGATQPLEGYPVLGRDTSYHFGGQPPTREQVNHMLEDLKAIPTQVTRPNTGNPVVSTSSPVREVSFHLPQAVIDFALGVATQGFLGKAYQVVRPIVSALTGKAQGRNAFAKYNGHVTVQTTSHAWYAIGSESTVPPIPKYTLPEKEALAATYPLTASYSSPARAALKESLEFAAGLTAAAAITHSVETLFRRMRNKPLILHRGLHALKFVNGSELWGTGGGDDSDSGDPSLPDVPDFDDVEDPGAIVPWSAAQKYFSGYVVDDNGTPITHYLSAEKHGTDYFSAITPRYYTNLRRPWDTETKRLLAFQIKVSEALKGHFLLLEGYNWGDDACASWLPDVKGGTYMGCVARFSGITEARSVIRVDDPDVWNASPVHMVVGQAKGKYRSVDKGRASLFAVRIGAVGLVDVAVNYLALSLSHKSVTRMKNHPMKKGSGAGSITPFPTHSDVRIGRADPDPNIDPNTPGFGGNYHALTSGTRALPHPVEDGPVRTTLLARYDDANGWWQDVPDAAWTDTDVSSRWTFTVKMDGTEHPSAKGDREPYVIYDFDPPSQLRKDCFLCEEMVSLGGSEFGQTTGSGCRITLGNDHDVVRGVSPGPLMISRTVFRLNEGKMCVTSVGDTSRPTTAVEAHDGDIYTSFIARYYIVKSEDVAKRWALWDEPGLGESTTGWKYFRSTFKLEPGTANEPWTIGEEVKGITFMMYTKANAPCSKSCSAFSETGYTAAKRRSYNRLLPGEAEPHFSEWYSGPGANGSNRAECTTSTAGADDETDNGSESSSEQQADGNRHHLIPVSQ